MPLMNKQKLVLINPVNTVRSGFSVHRSSRFPPLGLGIVAALTPRSVGRGVAGREYRAFWDTRETDVVGITGSSIRQLTGLTISPQSTGHMTYRW